MHAAAPKERHVRAVPKLVSLYHFTCSHCDLHFAFDFIMQFLCLRKIHKETVLNRMSSIRRRRRWRQCLPFLCDDALENHHRGHNDVIAVFVNWLKMTL